MSFSKRALMYQQNINMEFPKVDNPIGITTQEQQLLAINLGIKVKFTHMGASKIIKPGSLKPQSVLSKLTPVKK